MSRRPDAQEPKLQSDFDSFMSAPESPAPRWVGDELALCVRRDLEPRWPVLLSKLAGLHAVAGSLSLLLCPQFGVGAEAHSSPVMGFLMPYGELACALGCGAVFSFFTALSAGIFLTRDERRHVASKDLWVFSALMAASWGGLMLSGASQAGPGYTLAWLAAATLGARSVFRTASMRAVFRPL
jgi:hypothetical protein